MKMVINSEVSLAEAQVELARKFKQDKFVVCTIQKQQRTLTQGKSIHLYCKLLGNELNRCGSDMKKVFEEGFDIPWDKDSVKKLLWCKVQKAMFDTDSTSQLTTDQVSKVYEVLNRKMNNYCENQVPFPSKENMNQ